MTIRNEDIEAIVKQVLINLKSSKQIKNEELGIFNDVNDAVNAAKESQRILRYMSIDQRERIINKIREKTIENAKLLAQMGVNETGMGRVDHKIISMNLLQKRLQEPKILKQ